MQAWCYSVAAMVEARIGSPAAYSAKFFELRAKLVESLGSDTVDILLERAIQEIAAVYPGFRLHHNERGTTVELENDVLMQKAEEQDYVRSAYSGLYAALLIILAKLLGREIAVRLASSLEADNVLLGGPLASG